ncbi:uncharacterized protein LOC132732072 [Ruditapes philippinarum]|uniref:uncharacterized protein LOC132732072 n=1 Tax=Ruditapes philippinarum TaxID=129788 RepID=UPI00295C3724|nr:uncharacterized protein LOC132732072 [Ruditapes philippinarum]
MVFRLILLFYLVSHCVISAFSTNATIPGYHLWSYGERAEIFCPNDCKTKDYPEECCSCRAQPCWEINQLLCPVDKIYLEYLNIYGESILTNTNNDSVAELIHTGGSLSKLPQNICQIKEQLRKVDLRYNWIRSISVIKCLKQLDTLRLDFNLITYIANTSFTDMIHLRILTMSHNLIMKLEPNTIIIKGGNIPIIDFSNNPNMDCLDVSNVLRPGPFCTLNFTNSNIESITNDLGIVLDKVIHGPGDILLEHTHLGSFINFTSIGIEDMGDFPKYISGSLKLDSSSVNCDCTIFPILKSLGTEASVYWKNLDTFVCNMPESVKGLNLTEVAISQHYDDLTCDLSEKHTCPHYLCHCIDMPSQDKVLVNCTGVGLKSMPDEMPIGTWRNNRIDLILAVNKISVIPARKYYNRLINLDLSGNPVSTFSRQAAASILSTINIENQTLDDLPPILQHRDPNAITFGPHPIICNCGNTWIGDWIRLKKGQNRLNCSVGGTILPAEDVTEHFLNCNKFTPIPLTVTVSIAIGILAFVVFGIGLIFFFRNEITILSRMFVRKQSSVEKHRIDVFLSFYDQNSCVFRTVMRYIKPALVDAGYIVFIPWENIQYGDTRDDAIAIAANQSINFVIVLCDKYAENYNSVSELETIWNSFKADKAKQIILINYDDIVSSDIRDDRLRALSRIRYLDFKTRDSELIDRLIGKLGKPLPKQKLNTPKENDDKKDEGIINCIEGAVINDTLTVFERLAMPRPSECNCQYRRCYLHDETLFKRQGKATSRKGIRKVVPFN